MNKEKGYIILGYNEIENKYYGYVEHSFCMGFSDERVQVYSLLSDSQWKKRFNDKFYIDNYGKSNSPNQAIYFFCRHQVQQLNKKKYNGCTWKVYRINSKKCPVHVDLTEIILMMKKKMKYEKFKFRNSPFVVK